jgi:hypothetical protein
VSWDRLPALSLPTSFDFNISDWGNIQARPAVNFRENGGRRQSIRSFRRMVKVARRRMGARR